MIYRFGDIELDEARRTLCRGASWVQTEPKVFDVLLYLIKNRERAVMREELLDACWPRVHVSDGTLSRCMSRVRHAIGQPRAAAQPIYTLHGKGYRFVAPISQAEDTVAAGSAAPEVAARRPGQGPAAGEPERRSISLLDCGLALPAARIGDGAEAFQAALHRCVEDCEAVLQRFGGSLSQRGGEGVEARFGHPASAERAAEAAVLAAQEMLAQAKDCGLVARIGIASGRAIVDPPRPGAPGEAMVVGIDPLRPANLRAAAPAQSCVVDENTRHLTEGGFTARPAVEASVAGRNVPVNALSPCYRQARAAGDELAFYGRSSELAFLEHCWRYARDGHGQVIYLSGEAGIGKSRLIQELIRRAAVPADCVLQAECSPYHQLTPFYPLLLLLRGLLNIGPDTPPLRQLAAIEDLLRKLDQPESDHLPLLASLLSVSMPRNRLPDLHLDPARQRERTLEALVFLVYSLAQQQPVIFWVDDVQWADPSTLDVVARVRARCSSGNILVVLAGRGAEKRLQNNPAGATTIALGPFTKSETLSFLDAQSAQTALSRDQLYRIAASSDGVPLFLREIMRMTLAPAERMQSAAIPDTLQSLLQSRLDQAGEAKRLAQWIALFGPTVEKDVLARCCGIEEEELEAGLERLATLGLLRESGQGRGLRYGFNHSLLRDVAYDSLLASRPPAPPSLNDEKQDEDLKQVAVM